MSSSKNNQNQNKGKANIAWRYALFVVVLLVSGPLMHYINQYRRGHPLDIHYFWSELSPQGIFGWRLYNGSGGSDWKIGKALIKPLSANNLHSVPELKAYALKLVNRDRTLNKLHPLVEDSLLSQAAQLHAEDMLKRHYFNHITPEGKTPRDRFIAAGGSSHIGVGENILRGNEKGIVFTYGKVEEFQRGWMYSNGHRANLLTPEYTRFGYGFVVGAGGQTYAVQMFAEPAPAN
jgi:uncharacterized protein YkwD